MTIQALNAGFVFALVALLLTIVFMALGQLSLIVGGLLILLSLARIF